MANEIKVEIADTPFKREMGLQYRRTMPEMTGMLFKFQSPNMLSFWMKNTYLPLDIAFMEDDGVVINTARMVPLSLKAIGSERACALALEVPAGTFEKLGIGPGTKLSIDWESKAVSIDDNDQVATT